MAEFQQMPDGGLAALDLVGDHAGVVADQPGVGDRDRQAGRQGEGVRGGMLGPDDHQAVDRLVGEPLGGTVPAGRCGIDHLQQGDRVVLRLGGLDHRLGGERLAGTFEPVGEQADRPEGSVAERSRRPVRRVAQLIHGGDHPVAGDRTHRGRAGGDARHGLGRHAGQPGDVLDGRTGPLSAPAIGCGHGLMVTPWARFGYVNIQPGVNSWFDDDRYQSVINGSDDKAVWRCYVDVNI